MQPLSKFFTLNFFSVNKLSLIILLALSFLAANTQPITISDTAHYTTSCGLPYSTDYDYTYGQSIYYESEIQGSGYITALSFNYLDNNLSHSDSVAFYMGPTDSDYFKYLLKSVPLTKVFDSVISYSTLPGVITVQLKTPYYYNGVGNLVIAANELRAGYEASITRLFAGFHKSPPTGRGGRSSNVWYTQPIKPNRLDSLQIYALPVATGAGITANITIYGLTQFSCKIPKNVRFVHITHDSARVVWSLPASGNTPASYDLYYGTNSSKPTAISAPSIANIADTQRLLSSLLPGTVYFVWLRSRCSATDASVWTFVDSFKTLCAPPGIPTPPEPFSPPFPPNCWKRAIGTLTANATLTATNSPNEYWVGYRYRNQTGSTDSAASMPATR